MEAEKPKRGRPRKFRLEPEGEKRPRGRPRKNPHVRKCNINVRQVPVRLRDKFKATCSQRGVGMQDVIAELMLEYVRRHHGKLYLE